MAEVYAAYDPQLDRKVALKILRAARDPSDGRASTRLLREAKAIAKLSHPNVVTIHDAGAVNDRIFIAMEFVAGETLTEWLVRSRRSREEILQVFKGAARGLAAAHAAGLVHRDFKPQNVMVGGDGIVRVMDFGLVRDLGAPVDDEPRPEPDGAGLEVANVDLTRTGELLGTPRYMAPEQFRATSADARTDQFSFCIALYEALYGQRPFAGDNLPDIMANVVAGQIAPVPPKAAVPVWIRRILLRGLAVDPAQRFPSMDALLAALESDPAHRRRKWALGAVVLSSLVVLAAGAHRLGEGHRALCTGGAARFAGVWEPGGLTTERKAGIQHAFLASGQSYAAEAFRGASRLLDAYVARWTAMYTDACEATQVRGEQSAESLDLRMACLNERFGSLHALVDVFAGADAKAVENAVSAAAALPDLGRCADVPLLRAVIKPPEDEVTRKRVEELRGELAKLVAARDSGRCRVAIPAADALIPKTRTLGYQPLLAEALLAAGEVGDQCGDPVLMLARLKEAHTAANASRHEEVAATSSGAISFYAWNRLDDSATARLWLDVASGDVARLDRETFATGQLAVAAGQIEMEDRQYDRAFADIDRALTILRRVLGPDHPWTINYELDRGDWLERAGRLQEALEADRSIVAHYQRVLGPRHPQVGIAVINLGEVLNLLGRYDEGAAAYQQALDILRASGADKTLLAWALTGIGRARIGQKSPETAIAPLEEALSIREAIHAPMPQLAETRFALARALWSRPASRSRARTIALAARANPESAREIDAWLRTVGGPETSTERPRP
jgi:tetratricopeptide (TPR) repeat protein